MRCMSQTLHCVPIASAEGLRPEKLGQATLVEELETSEGKIVKITGVPQPSRTVSILCRGSNKLVRTLLARVALARVELRTSI